MSNNVVGNVYQQVIDDVINASRVDFEEGGVEDSVLEELKQGWQQKLSQLDVASFPWDPKPEPAPAPAPAPAAQAPVPQQQPSQQAPYTQTTMSPQPNAGGLPLPGANGAAAKQEPSIKQEPGVPTASSGMMPQGDVAQQRAMQNITQKFGDKASEMINAQQAGANQRPTGQQPPLPQTQGVSLPQQPGQQQQQSSAGDATQPSLPGAQTDGAADADVDMEGILMQRGADGTLNELGRVDIDRMLHSRMLANAKSMEGGGLMLPLKEATKHQVARSSSKKGKARDGGPAQYDGEDDDDNDVADEDAINSDLDDSDEDKDEDEVDDEGLGHIMLCMYDKVQRVKNKWKCTMKDGVLTVNGKEYVFHKATGEYEW